MTNAEVADYPFDVTPLHQGFGAEVIGVDLEAGLDDGLFAAVWDAFVRHQMLLFRGQDLTPDGQVAFARRFGEVQVHVMNQYHAAGHPELYYLSNLDADGKPNGVHPDRGTMAWHTDGSWSAQPGQATILFAETVPVVGGETHFADMYRAYDALDDDIKQRLAGMRAVHNLDFSRNRRHGEDPMTEEQKAAMPPIDHPVVRTHPDSGQKALFLGDHAWIIDGMDEAQGRALIERLNSIAVRDDNVYRHRWRPGDLAVWDNRCMLHRATEYDTAGQPRVIRRCTVLGERPV